MIDYRNIPLEAKKKEIEDYRKLLPQAKSIYDQPKEFVYKIDYDAKHDTADVLREFYQASDDPSSRIKQQGAAQIVKLLNPDMDPAYIERNIGKLIEASVGQKLDYENTFDEFVSTFKSSSNDLRIGAKYMDLYRGSSDIFGTEEFEVKKSELLDEVRRMPAQKRTDYMPLALLTDMLVSTGNILPSSLPSVGMYLAGGVVNAVAPGLGTLLAKTGSSSYAGFQEAGGTLKTLVDFRDSEGNQLSDEAIWTITQMVWAGVTAVNFFTDPFEKMFSTGAQKLASKVITKESVKGILKSGNSSVWKAIAKGAAKKGVMDVVEGVQEMAEDLVDILAVNAGVKKYNEEYDTDFTTTSYEEAKKELAATFKETTKGMFFMSLPGNVLSTFKNINSKSSTAMRDANKVSGFTKDSQVISPSSVVVPKSVKGMDTFKESAGPIEVVKVGDSYIPTNKNDASFFASIKEKNTKGVNVVVQNQTGESTTTSSVFAENIADKLALGWKDNAVVFKSAEDAKKAAEKFAINSQGRVTGYTEANGVYTVSLESNGEIHDIVFTHKNNISDYTKSEVREDSKPTPTNTEQTTNNAKDIKGVARKFNTADSKKLQKQIKKAMPRLSPNENKIAAAMFGMMAEAQGMTIDEFLEANYKNGEIFGSAKDGALEGFRGYVEFGDDLKAVIYAAEHSDFSTFSHETFHVAFRSLGKQAEFSQIIQDAAATEEFHTWMSEHGQLFEDNVFKDVDLSEFAKTFMDSEWSNTHEEFLARVFEGYLSDGKSLSPKLKPLLAIISDWFKEIYHSIKHTVDLDSRIVEAFDSMLDKDTKLQAEVRGEATVDATVDATTDTARESTDTTGKPTILKQGDVSTDSKAFKEWFGDSKIVDENGKPLEVYHGTDGSFDTFNNVGERLPSLGYGYYFTPDIEKAKQYGNNVMPVYLNSEKVLDWGNLSKQDRVKIIDRLESKVPDSAIAGYGKEVRKTFKDTKKGREEGIKFFEQKKIDTQEYFHEAAQARTDVSLDGKSIDVIWNEAGLENASNHDLLALAQQYDMQIAEILGYDAARFGSEIVVFSNNQIKSVNNEGTWNSADPNILHQSDVKPLSKNSKEYKETKKRVQDMLKNKEYPKDHELALFKGEEWADKEISFRRLYAQDDMLVSKFEEAYDAYIDEITSYDEKTGEEVVTPAENENKRILEILHEQDRTTFDNIEDSIGDTESFIGRMKQQIELMTPKVADQGFKAALSDDSFVLEVASMLTGDLDPTQDSDISKYLFRLANDENPSGHTLRYARKALIDNVREYRRMIYEMDGETAQLSYERAIEGTEIGEGVESLGVSNTEVKNLLNSELSEEIRTMIEENIATDTTLTAIIEDNLSKATSIENKNRSIKAMSDNIAEINERIAEITAELEQQADETASLDEGRAETLQNLKDKSKALSRAKADLKRVKIARDALKTKAAIKKITSKLDVHAKDSVNTADARMTSLMQKFLSILRTPNTEGIDYRILLKDIGVDFDTLPGILKNYFVASDDVLLLKSTLSNMSIDEIIQLEKDMKEMKAAARHLLTERKEKSRSASNWVKTEFYSQRTGEKFATVADYHDYVDNLKYESGPKTSKSKESQKGLIKSMFETNLLTGSRWVRRIDGKMDGAVSKWIFGGELEDGTVWKGVEGVIDQELKRSNERYKKATEFMKKKGLTDKHMIGKFKINGEPVVMRGQTITNQRAIAVYIYDQQKKGKVLLRSLDGNGFTNSEVKKIIDNLTESQKKLGDFMIEDFASVRGEVEETYYKVNNKMLGWEDNYFPLVGTGDNARFSSVLESSQGKPSSDPRHTFTEQRTGEVYKLNLDVVTSWASMVKQQEHYIAGAEYFSQTQNLMNKHGGDLYSAISETKGPVYAAKLQEFIDGLADHKTALDEADNAINAVRNNLIVARLGFNVITALKQIPSFGAFAMEYGPIELAKAFIQVGTDYKGSMELINEMAPQIKYRSFTSEYQALMNIQGTSQYKLAKKGFAQFSMKLITTMDKAVVNTLWIGSYNNSIAHNLSPEMAAMKATKFINDTQPTGNFKDNAMLYSSNSPIWKFLLMFTNQLNKYLNIAYDIPFELKEHMYHQAIGGIVSLGINTAGIVLLSGGMLRADGDDDDEYWDQVLGEIQGTMLSVVPVVGPLVAPIVKNQYFPDTSMPMVSELAQLWSANKLEDPEKRKESIEKALINMGFAGVEVGGFPAAGAGKKIYKSLTKKNIGYLLNSAYGDRMGDL